MNDMEPVRYVQLPSLGGHYFVGSDGTIHRLYELKPSVNKKRTHAYEIVQLFDQDGKKYYASVHKIVAHCFLGPRPSGMVIDHLDGNKLNNCASNLEYVTSAENTRRSYAAGTRFFNPDLIRKLAEKNRGQRSKNRKFTDAQAREIISKYESVKCSMKSLGQEYGCSAVTIFNMIHGTNTYQYIKRCNAPTVRAIEASRELKREKRH